MKLLYIATKITGAGGMQRVLLVKAGYLAEKAGYKVTILTTNSQPGEEPLYEVSPAIRVKDIRPLKGNAVNYFLSYKNLVNQAIDEVNPDVVVICDNGLKSFLLPLIVRRKLPLIYERHGSKYLKEAHIKDSMLSRVKDRLTYKLMNFCGARFARFVALTHRGASEWHFKNVAVIPNPLWFYTGEVSTLQNKRAVIVARHTYEKGYDRLFKIWHEVTVRNPDWVLDIYGEDDPEYDIRQLAANCGLTNQVNFYKPVKDIIEVYKSASLYLMTSRSEGFGMVLLEAMACGVPCVAFDCPTGPGELVINEQNGYLVPDGDIKSFTEQVNKIIKDYALRAELGAKAREHAALFSLEAIMKQWDMLFRSLLK